MDELNFLSAAEMAAKVRRRRVSPIELVRAHLSRIEELNPKLNAFVQVDAERALNSARRAEEALRAAKTSDALGPLHGVPISIKSSIDVAGLRCEAGTNLRRGFVPTADAPLVKRLKSAGAIVLGNTNTPELLMAYETDNLLYGRTNSPWDLSRTPGGSSGGEAAAIAAGCSAAGVGSDGGGSVRVPAHFSGICGLKPTPGRIPATGHFPESVGPFALMGVVGPMARTIGDVRLLFDAIAGADAGDPSAAPVPVRHPSSEEARKLRIGFFERGGGVPVTPETRAAVRAAVQLLQQQGFEVEEFAPENLDRIQQLWWNLFGRAGQLMLGPMIDNGQVEISAILKSMREMASRPPLTVNELLATLVERDALRGPLLTKMEKHPILLCPVCAIPAFRHGEREWQVDGRRVEYIAAMSYSQWFNIMGNPAAVVPMSFSPERLPIGVQIVGRPHREEEVLAVAEHLEAARGSFPHPAV